MGGHRGQVNFLIVYCFICFESHLSLANVQVEGGLAVCLSVCCFVVCLFLTLAHFLLNVIIFQPTFRWWLFVCSFFFFLAHFLFRWWVGWQDMLKRDGELGWIRLQLMLEEEEEQEEQDEDEEEQEQDEEEQEEKEEKEEHDQEEEAQKQEEEEEQEEERDEDLLFLS